MATLKTPVTPEDHVQGPENAAATLVEYGDYECPHCGSAYSIVKRVQKHFGNGLRFVFRNFPLSEIHPHAESAAETAEFAGLTESSGRCTMVCSKTRNAWAGRSIWNWRRSSACLLPSSGRRSKKRSTREGFAPISAAVCAAE